MTVSRVALVTGGAAHGGRSQYESLRRTIAVQVPPPDFRVTALMTCFNEADILDDVIGELAAQGVGVYVIDNWSSDDSFAVAEARKGRGVVGLERFPGDGPSSTYDWARLLGRVEQLAQELESDWYVHHDADEISSDGSRRTRRMHSAPATLHTSPRPADT